MKESSPKVEFPPPKGFVPPEGSEAGKPFDVVCTFEVRDGKLCLKVLGETEMPGYNGDREESPPPDYKDMAAGTVSDMAAGGVPEPVY